jgi:GAF domain-containing protein
VVSRWLSARLSPSLGVDTLISQTLDVVLELVGFDRGFVLYARQGDALRVRAQRGLVARDIADAAFAGSAAAVDQALTSGRSVVCCDTSESPWLGARPSVRLGGIRALLCVPLQVARDSFGALYADSRRPGPPVTELDLELIQSVASHVAAVLSARELRGEMAQLLRAAADAGLDAPRWDELHTAPAGQTKSRVDEG